MAKSRKQIRNQKLLNKIAARAKSLREIQGRTQEQFYFDTGIHIARIEAADPNITVSTLEFMCRHLGVSLEEFFKAEEFPKGD